MKNKFIILLEVSFEL